MKPAPVPDQRMFNGNTNAVSSQADGIAAAKAAHLKYVSDDAPGIRRKTAGKGFTYIGLDGKPLRDRKELARIRSLAIPPAYSDVWICADSEGHIQATGRDQRGRKQYRYHPKWREVRDANKYDELVAFGKSLRQLRAKISEDMKQRGLTREKVLATIVALLDRTLIRVGNAGYAKENQSYGLTTLRNRHVTVDGTTLRFEFTGKSGKAWKLKLQDRRIARVVKACHDLPGQILFQYLDENGERHPLNSSDVNAYLQQISGREVTAKHFRTWAGTVMAAAALSRCEVADKPTVAKRVIKQAIETVAKRLGNTQTICRKCYVHPEIVSAYLDGDCASLPAEEPDGDETLTAQEAAVLDLLEKRLAKGDARHKTRSRKSSSNVPAQPQQSLSA